MAQAAEILNVSYWTVREQVIAGALPCFRIGKRVRFFESDLRKHLAAGYRAQPVEEQAGWQEKRYSGGRTAKREHGGSGLPSQTAREYAKVLELPTGDRRKSCSHN
jgi:excisionase family DNA binding protein